MSSNLAGNLYGCTVAESRSSGAAVHASPRLPSRGAHLWKALVMGLYLFVAAAPPVAAQECTPVPDVQLADDEPGQKDLTQFCAGGTCEGKAKVRFSFDNTDWSGSNTGDACVLFDTDTTGPGVGK